MQGPLRGCHRLRSSALPCERKWAAAQDTVAGGGRADEGLDVLENQLVSFKVSDIRRLRRIVHCGQTELALRQRSNIDPRLLPIV